MLRNLLLLSLFVGCTGKDDEDTDKTGDDSAADTDTDTDADTDTDTDTDTNTGADLSTYAGFVDAHAHAYCASLESCGFLDDQGYTDKADCIAQLTDFLSGQSCDNYAQATAERCVDADRGLADSCPGTGEAPVQCREVCAPPPQGG